jgi:hypothetical protein
MRWMTARPCPTTSAAAAEWCEALAVDLRSRGRARHAAKAVMSKTVWRSSVVLWAGGGANPTVPLERERCPLRHCKSRSSGLSPSSVGVSACMSQPYPSIRLGAASNQRLPSRPWICRLCRFRRFHYRHPAQGKKRFRLLGGRPWWPCGEMTLAPGSRWWK